MFQLRFEARFCPALLDRLRLYLSPLATRCRIAACPSCVPFSSDKTPPVGRSASKLASPVGRLKSRRPVRRMIWLGSAAISRAKPSAKNPQQNFESIDLGNTRAALCAGGHLVFMELTELPHGNNGLRIPQCELVVTITPNPRQEGAHCANREIALGRCLEAGECTLQES
jgi:hypothetical protein